VASCSPITREINTQRQETKIFASFRPEKQTQRARQHHQRFAAKPHNFPRRRLSKICTLEKFATKLIYEKYRCWFQMEFIGTWIQLYSKTFALDCENKYGARQIA
jgi:hypothetical protein